MTENVVRPKFGGNRIQDPKKLLLPEPEIRAGKSNIFIPGTRRLRFKSSLMTKPSRDTSKAMSEETDAKIAAAEARQETRLAQAIGEMRTQNAEILGEFRAVRSDLRGEFEAMRAEMNGRFETFDARLQGVERSTSGLRGLIITTAVTTFLGLIAIVFGALAWGDSLFSRGMSVQQTMDQSAQRAVDRMTDQWQRMLDASRQP